MFTHLHVHSHFSFGQGASSPEALVEAAIRRGFSTLACTDTNGVYGAVEFQLAAEAAGVRAILGAHLVANGREAVVLAEDERGWAALCRAVTAIHWSSEDAGSCPEGPGVSSPRYGPKGLGDHRTDRSAQCAAAATRDPSGHPAPPDHSFAVSAQLALDRKGLIVLSADIELLEQLMRLSGPEDIYAELRPGRERHAVLAAARRLGLPVVATNAVMFANPEDWARHRLLVAIANNTTLSALSASSALSALSARDGWLKGAAELARHFPDCPEALDAAALIAERCRYRIPIGERVVAPRFAVGAGLIPPLQDDAMIRLRALAYEGAERRYGTMAPVTRDRLEHELAIIAQKGFADYFLVVRDIVEHGPTHCGRGSVANSIVSYALGITHVDPLAADLLFERFLNPERKDPPDIDLDFPWDERDHVLAYVFRTWPHPKAAMVANHNCFRLRGALREVAKVHGRPAGEIREVTKRIPWYEEDALEHLLATHPNFAELDLPLAWREYAQLAQPLVGVPRHLSLHPGGVVIVPTALTDYVPTQPAVKVLDGAPDLTVPAIQFEKDGTEDAGLVKIDLLGNRSLAVIRDAIAMVKANTGVQLDYSSSDAGEDPATRALFRTGKTMGVFYTESPASRVLCQKSRAETFDLLVLNTSIIRPAANDYIRTYLERLHGAPYEPLDPCLQDVLSETFGIMVYQEDVVNVCAEFAGMPLATGDGLRKALSKKRPVKHLAAYAEEFFTGAAALGRDPETAKRVWEMVMSFAGYSFCKGHSCSYIQVAQQSCYLRAHFPAEFFAAVLANGGGFYDPFAYVAEAWREGCTVLPPDVNTSEVRTTGRGQEVRIGLQFVKGLSAGGMERIVEERKGGEGGQGGRRSGDRAGPLPPSPPSPPSPPHYRSLADFRERTGLAAEDLRILIKAGALDAIANGMTRPMMLWEIDRTEGRKDGRTEPPHAPSDLPSFRLSDLSARLPLLRDYSQERKRAEQYSSLGFTTDCHPITLYRDRLARFRLVRSSELHRVVGRTVLLAGMLTTTKAVSTIHDEPMEFATFDDGDGLIETVLFPDVYRTRGHVLFDQGPFVFRGKVEEEFGAVTVTITHLERLERMLAKLESPGSRVARPPPTPTSR